MTSGRVDRLRRLFGYGSSEYSEPNMAVHAAMFMLPVMLDYRYEPVGADQKEGTMTEVEPCSCTPLWAGIVILVIHLMGLLLVIGIFTDIIPVT